MAIRFEWDPAKGKLSSTKHGVTFEKDSSVFLDDFAKLIADPDHVDFESRLLILGISHLHRLLVVSRCYRDNDSVIRLISARRASPGESPTYLG